MSRFAIAAVMLLVAAVASAAQPSDTAPAAAAFSGPINAAVGDKQHVVIVVPTKEADDAVGARIRAFATAVRDRLFGPATPVITDAEALERDLSANVVLVYGTPTGNLYLAKLLPTLPVKVEADRIVVDKAVPGSDLRLITTWPNPQNPQKGIVIYTAQRAVDVVNINSVFPGPEDYVVARGTQVLRSGTYRKTDGKWTLAAESLTLQEALDDLDFMLQTIESVHPRPLAQADPAKFAELKRVCSERLKDAAGPDGRVARSVLAVTLAQAAAAYGDGHTSCFLPGSLLDPSDPARRMLPLRLEYGVGGQILVGPTVAALRALQGRQVLKMDGLDTLEFLRPILSVLPGEREAFRTSMFIADQTVYWAVMTPARGTQIALTLQDEAGATEVRTVDLITLSDFERQVPADAPQAAGEPVRFYDEGKTCYWRYDSFDYSDTADQKTDALFSDLSRRRTTNLIMDLRGNGGGNSRAGDTILSYLTPEPYRFFSRVDTRVSQAAINHYPELARLLAGRADQLVTENVEGMLPQHRGELFVGKLFLLIGPRTFSSAAQFAAVVKDYGLGTLIGEETGGLREAFGDRLTFTCPNSGIGFGVSFKRFYAPIPKPGDDAHGTVPDVPVDRTVLSPYAGEADPVLAFALHYVGAGK